MRRYEAVFDLCVRGLFQRFFKHADGHRFAHERALAVGLAPHWTVPEIGKLAGRKRTWFTVKAQAVVRRYGCVWHVPQWGCK